MVGSAKLRKRDHENKTGGNCGATSPLYLDHTLIFSSSFHLRVILRLSYSSPNGELVNPTHPHEQCWVLEVTHLVTYCLTKGAGGKLGNAVFMYTVKFRK